MEAETRAGSVIDPRVAAQRAMERSNIYGFLAAVYRAEPSAELLRRIRSPSFLQALRDAGVAVEDNFLDRPDAALLSDLSLEYGRLFIGPGRHVSLHESVHSPSDTGSLWGRSTIAVKNFVESVGVEFRPEYRGIPDHISVELEFMQRLTELEAEARRQDGELAARWLQIEQRFVEEHLAKWVPPFCDKVLDESEHFFYREMARLTRAFISLEHQELTGLAQGDPVT